MAFSLLFDPFAAVRAMNAEGQKWMTHAQALIDCFPESQLSAAEKEHCWKFLEERPRFAKFLLMPAEDQGNLRWIKQAFVTAKLRNPDAPHHYRGFAETPQPQSSAVSESAPTLPKSKAQ